MYERVIVPLDGSQNSERVLPYVEELAQRTHCDLTFVGVSSDQERSFEYIFKKYVQDLAVQFKNKGLRAQSAFLYGSPSEEIIRYADTNGASLIAAATHGRSGFQEWILGGVSEKILLHSSKPVLLISARQPGTGATKSTSLQNVLVPLDGSEAGEAALPWAEELAKSTNGRLVLLRVVLSTSKVVGVMNYATGFERQLVSTLRGQAREYLTSVVAELEKKGLDTKYDLIEGIPSEAILDYAKQNSIDLIVMTKHGMSAPSRAVLGSVVHQVVHASDIPILVVPVRVESS